MSAALEVALVWLAPWRAARTIREDRRHFASLCDVILVQAEQLGHYEPERPQLRVLEGGRQ